MDERVEIIDVLARYVRAIEDRDGDALVALFAPAGRFEVLSRRGKEEYVTHALEMVGHEALRAAMKTGELPPGHSMQYLTTDHIVDIAGDEARLRAQFLAVQAVGKSRPEDGWPSGAGLMQGTLTPIMIGHYDSHLRRIGGRWVFTRHQVKHSVPMTLPLKS